ncbi:carbonic anhydrase [Aeromonas hydrophila]|uniref:carbonic anhydrase n=1 Tax=Aeromonas hydrophila TaxID=644 RepID=UPI0029D5B541|nr:carbonic anhydrase [Aeromonas hydrophila]MDX7758403.1 carbonic anhydrase [Aeromonas hydrophila]
MRKSLLAATLLLCPTAFAATPHWEYSGEAGPAQWARLTPEFGQCAGSNQSPVNLDGLVEAELAPLQFHYLAGGRSVTNNGHTVQVDYAPGSSLELDGMRFELKQFHFHAPSENLIKGKSYPLEGHLVHANAKGELAVVAVMFESGRANAALSQAWQVLPAKAGESHAFKEPISAEQLLPAKRDYYRFSGSLTTPPCSEGVRWLVMKQPVQVSQAQIDAFKAVMHHPNNRPVQPLHGRLVLQ